MNIRVLHVAAVDFTAARLLRPQMNHLKSRGLDVRVACGRSTTAEWADLADFNPIDLAFPRTPSPVGMLRSTLRLQKLVRDWRPDIIHLHTPAAALPVRIWPKVAWPSRSRIVYTVHGYLHPWPPERPRDRVLQKIEKWESNRTHVTLFQSREDFENAIALNYGGNPTYLGNGVAADWFALTPPTPCTAGQRLRVLFVGRLVREKGILDLVSAVREVPNIELHVAGESLQSDRDGVSTELHALATGEMRGQLKLHGMLKQSQLQQLYLQMHAFCLPSYREGVPRSVIEALAAARPVMASNIRGNRELVKDGANGFLFEAGNVREIRESLGRLSRLSASEFEVMSDCARSSADPALRETAVMQRLILAYASVLKLRSDVGALNREQLRDDHQGEIF